ncbi:MAG: acylphosphatase [Kiritimatiellia bacterium]
MKHYSLRVRGIVQGVGFRYATREAALTRNLSGYVKNEPDGTVSVEVEGPVDELAAFLAWCREGPPGSQVEQLDCKEGPCAGWTTFRIAY